MKRSKPKVKKWTNKEFNSVALPMKKSIEGLGFSKIKESLDKSRITRSLNDKLFYDLKITFIKCEEGDKREGLIEFDDFAVRIYYGDKWKPFIFMKNSGSDMNISREFWNKYGCIT